MATVPRSSSALTVSIKCKGASTYLSVTNATVPGTGWWFGLYIPWLQIVEQIEIGLPPFLGSLDMSGAATWSYPGTGQPFPIWFQTLTFYLVNVTFSPSTGYPSGSSSIVSASFQ